MQVLEAEEFLAELAEFVFCLELQEQRVTISVVLVELVRRGVVSPELQGTFSVSVQLASRELQVPVLLLALA